MADGSIIQRKGDPRISCGLNEFDGEHVRALCEFVGRGQLRSYKKLSMVYWGVYSQPMADDLARWGIVPRKGAQDDTAPKGEARMSVDFWRGMIDGDGHIRMSGRSPQIGLTGRRGISQAFVEFLEANIRLRYYRHKKKLTIHEYPSGGGTKVILNGLNALSLCELLYARAPLGLYLPRKRKAAMEITNHHLEKRRLTTEATDHWE